MKSKRPTTPPGSDKDFDSEVEYELEPIHVVKFGNDELVRAANEPRLLKELLSRNDAQATPNAIMAAIDCKSLESLNLLLAAKGDPNAPLNPFRNFPTKKNVKWSCPVMTPEIVDDQQRWPPLKYASQVWVSRKRHKPIRKAIITSLLDHNANLYALYPQPLKWPDQCLFPGEEVESAGQAVVGEGKIYTVRCLIHSIIENSGCIEPIFNHTTIKLDLEHRDPLGRTLLHSACRSNLGPDAILNAVKEDADNDNETGWYVGEPYKVDEKTPSLFDELLKRGANVSAVDTFGKTVIHHLLEAESFGSAGMRPPRIRNSLRTALTLMPSLVNQPDQFGTYPLHAALQRWRRYPYRNLHTNLSGLEDIVEDLLAAGADPKAVDGRGNTAIHYLCSDGVSERLHSEAHRRLLLYFVRQGVDVNARNNLGQTALEFVLDDDGKESRYRTVQYWREFNGKPMPDPKMVDADVFADFDVGGADWHARTSEGQSLLHLAARHPIQKNRWRVRWLIRYGLDPDEPDEHGVTAGDLCREFGDQEVLDSLYGYGTDSSDPDDFAEE